MVALLLAATGGSAAASDRAVDDAYRAGLEMRRHGDDRGALREFQRAYATTPNPRTLAQIGLAEQALGIWVDAEGHLTEALKAGDDSWIAKNKPLLQQQLQTVAGHLGTLVVESTTPGVTLEINGVAAGALTAQRQIRVVAGTVVLSARAPGFFAVQRFAMVAPGQLAHEQIDLVPTSMATSGEATKPGTAGPGTHAPAGEATPAAVTEDRPKETPGATPPDAADKGDWRRPAAWVALGLAAASLGTGVTFHVLHETRIASYNRTDSTGANVCNRDASGNFVGPSDCAAAFNGAATARTLMIVGYTGAALFGAATAYLFWTAPHSGGAATQTAAARPRATSRSRLVCGMGPGAAGLACTGSF